MLFVSKTSDVPRRQFLRFPVDMPTGRPVKWLWEPRARAAGRGWDSGQGLRVLLSVTSLGPAGGLQVARARPAPRVGLPLTSLRAQDNPGQRCKGEALRDWPVTGPIRNPSRLGVSAQLRARTPRGHLSALWGQPGQARWHFKVGLPDTPKVICACASLLKNYTAVLNAVS